MPWYVLMWAIAIVLGGLVVAAGICGVTMLQGWLAPIYKRLESRPAVIATKEFKVDYRPCCPPGIGCNERDRDRRTWCRRQMAHSLATPGDLERLEAAWSAYCREPSLEALALWEDIRDHVIHERTKQLDDGVRKDLMGAMRLPQLGSSTDDSSQSGRLDSQALEPGWRGSN